MDGSIHMRSPSSAWRGKTAEGSGSGKAPPPRPTKVSLFSKLGHEVMEHSAETAALVTMAVALSRVLPRPGAGLRSGSPRSRRRSVILPLGLMAALCVLGLSG